MSNKLPRITMRRRDEFSRKVKEAPRKDFLPRNITRKQLLLVAAGAAALALVVTLLFWWNQYPQMGTDEEVFKTVDALFTAVTARDPKLLDQCEQRLIGFKTEGKLPAEPWSSLENIIQRAGGGDWESAAQRLYDFMIVQRRDSPRKK